MAEKPVTPKLTVPIKTMFAEADAFEIMQAAADEELDTASFVRRGMKVFMKVYRKQRAQESKDWVSAFGLLGGPDQ